MRFKKTMVCLTVGGMLFSHATFAFANVSIATTEEVRVVEQQVVAYETVTYPTLEVGAIGEEANITESEALSLAAGYAETYFQIDVEAEGQNFNNNINYREDWNSRGRYVWEISFSRYSMNQHLNISVTIKDEDGELIELRKYGDDGKPENQIARYTQQEAEAIAHQFLLKTNQAILNQLIMEPNYNNQYYSDGNSGLNPREYYVFYVRQENGVPIMSDGVQIGVNSGTGEVSSYSLNWREDSLPQGKAAITPAEAMEVFKDQLQLQLMYIPVMDRSSGRGIAAEAKLVYSPSYQGGIWIDATTGKMIDYTGIASEKEKTLDLSDKEKEAFKKLKSTRKVHTKEISKEEAMALATAALEKLYGDATIKIESVNYSSNNYNGDGNRRKVWNINFRLSDDVYNSGNLTIDALTEEITQVYNYNWRMREMMGMSQEEFQPTIEWEDAYHKAIEVLKSFYPEKLQNLDLQQVYRENVHYYNDQKVINPEYYFHFNRREKDIAFSGNQIDVSIDSTTGMIQSVSLRWNDMKLPEEKDLVAEEEVIDLMMQQSEAKLAYTRVPVAGNIEEGEMKLVYMNSPKNTVQYNYIDAHSGALLDWNGQEVALKDGRVETVEEALRGHWAEKELNIMVSNGVIDLQRQDLKDPVIKNEIVKMMVQAMGYWYYSEEQTGELKFTDVNVNDEYYEYLQAAVMYKFIDNEAVPFNGYEPVSKQDFAQMLVKMTPLEKAAAIKEIYTLPVEDATEVHPDKLGSVALMYGLDILNGGDVYQPKEAVALDEVAVAIYRAFRTFGRNRW